MLSRIRSLAAALMVISIYAGASSAFAQALDTGYNPNAAATVRDVHVLSNGNSLVAGNFSTIDSHNTSGIALLDSSGNAITGFVSGLLVGDKVLAFAIDASGNIVVAGSTFASSGFVRRLNGTTGALDASFNAFSGVNGTKVNDVAIQTDGQIIIVGDFTTADGVAANRVARLSGTNGDRDLSFDPDADLEVYAVAIQSDGKILLGGDFTTIGSNAHVRIARVETNGGHDSTFNPTADARVLDIAVQLDGKILLAGEFGTLSSNAGIKRLGRVNSNGTLDATFAPSAAVLDWTVSTIEIQADTKVLVGGVFANSIARFNADGSTDAGFAPTDLPSNPVNAIAVQQNGGIVFAGSFTTVGATTRNRVARYQAPNAAPVVGSIAGPVGFGEGAPAVQVATAATITDTDSGDFDTGTLTVSITTGMTTDDQLAIAATGGLTLTQTGGVWEIDDGTNVIASYPDTGAGSGINGVDLVITFNANCTPALGQTVLQQLMFNNLSQNPVASKTLSVTVTDGDGGTSNVETVNVALTGVNDAPTLTSVTPFLGGQEDTASDLSHAILAPAADEADVDNATIDFVVTSVPIGSLTIGGSAWAVGTNDIISTGAAVLWTPPLNSNDVNLGSIHNALKVQAWDGALASGSDIDVLVEVLPVNDIPTLTAVSTLTGATMNTLFVIPFATFASAADEADVDSTPVNFRIESITSGTLTINSGAVTAGTTIFTAADQLEWQPPATTAGVLSAFTVVAFDGTAPSSSAIQVSVDVVGPTLTVKVPAGVGTNASLPHLTWDGEVTTLKAVAYGGVAPFTFEWDFNGDGTYDSGPTAATGANMAFANTYTVPATRDYVARVRCTDAATQVTTHDYLIRVYSTGAVTDSIKADKAIGDGLWYLHTQMVFGTFGANDTAYLNDGSTESQFGATGVALQAFQNKGHRLNGSNSNPYVDDVTWMQNWLLSKLVRVNIATQTAGDPDSNSNGYGLSFNGGRVYGAALATVGLATSNLPNQVAPAGFIPEVSGHTYADICQDVVDWWCWSMGDTGSGIGSWAYTPNAAGLDGSQHHFGATALHWCHEAMGSTIPTWVADPNTKTGVLNTAVVNSQHANGSFGYSNAAQWRNHAKTAGNLATMDMVGYVEADTRVQDAFHWIGDNWAGGIPATTSGVGSSSYPGNSVGGFYFMYSIMKGCRAFSPQIDTISNTANTLTYEWYPILRTFLLGAQQSNGRWQHNVAGSIGPLNQNVTNLMTAMGVEILETTFLVQPPVAVAASTPSTTLENNLVQLDHSGSYHLDSASTIILYEWDADGDGTYEFSTPNPFITYAWSVGAGVGTRNPVLRVTDNFAKVSIDNTLVITVASAGTNVPPVAIAIPVGQSAVGADYIYDMSTETLAQGGVQFDGSTSFDPNAAPDMITAWDWDLNADNIFGDLTTANPIMSQSDRTTHVPGWIIGNVYSIALRVTDNNSAVSYDSATILVISNSSTAVAIPAARVKPTNADYIYNLATETVIGTGGVQFDGSDSFDLNPSENVVAWEWDINNDGTFGDLVGVNPFMMQSDRTTFVPGWVAGQVYVVSLRVTDDGTPAGQGTDTATILVVNEFVTVTAQTVNTDEDTNVTVTLTGSSVWNTTPVFRIDSLPSNGVLYQTPDGTTLGAVIALNDAVTDTQQRVIFAPAPNGNGTGFDSFSYEVDDGTYQASATITVDVNAVNDPPSFTKGADIVVGEDFGAFTAPWATSISEGPADESSQTLTFNVTAVDTTLFSVQPAISAGGVLAFTTAPNFFGTTSVNVSLTDNGGGADTSAVQTFNITLNAVNDAPSFTASTPATTLEDSGLVTVSSWAGGFVAGPANESGQSLLAYAVTVTGNSGLFTAGGQPAVDTSGNLTYTPFTNAFGSATIEVTVQDDGGTPGVDTSAPQTFTITVDPVNDAPAFVASNPGDVSRVPALTTVAGWAGSLGAGGSIYESAQTWTFSVSITSGAALMTSLSVNPAGDLLITPQGSTSGTVAFDVTMTDTGGTANGGVDALTLTGFTFDVIDVAILYVNDGWTGTSAGTDPDGIGPATSYGTDSFDTFDAAYAAAGPGTLEIVTTGGPQSASNPVAKVLKLNGGTFTGGLELQVDVEIVDLTLNGGAGTALIISGGIPTFTGNNSFDANTGATLVNNQTAQPINIELVSLTLNSVAPIDMFAVENAVFHAMDSLTSGVVTWTANNWFATTANLGIQRAISFSTSGTDTVHVGAGVFDEYVLIDEDITLIGQGAGNTIIAPSTGPVNQAAIQIDSTGVTVRNLQVNIDQDIFNCGVGSLSTQACNGVSIENVTVVDVGTALAPAGGGWGGSNWGIGFGFVRNAASTDEVDIVNSSVLTASNGGALARGIWLKNLQADVTGTLPSSVSVAWIQGVSFELSRGSNSTISGMAFPFAGVDLSSPRSEIDVTGCDFSLADPTVGQPDAGVHARDFTQQINITGNSFANHKIGVFVGSCQNVLIDGNTFQSTDNALATYDYSHIVINSAYATNGTPAVNTMDNIVVNGNTFSNDNNTNSQPVGRAIDLRDGNGSTWTNPPVITGNTFETELPEFIRMQTAGYLGQNPTAPTVLTGPFINNSNNPNAISWAYDIDVSTNDFAGITLNSANGGEIIRIESSCYHRNDNPYLGKLLFGFPTLVDVASTGNDTPTDNDFITLIAALDAVGTGQTVQLTSGFDLTQTNAAAALVLGRDGLTGATDANLDGWNDDLDDNMLLMVPKRDVILDGNNQLVVGPNTARFVLLREVSFNDGTPLPANADFVDVEIVQLDLNGFGTAIEIDTPASGPIICDSSSFTNCTFGLFVRNGSEINCRRCTFTGGNMGVAIDASTLTSTRECYFIGVATCIFIGPSSSVAAGAITSNWFDAGSTGIENQTTNAITCDRCWWGSETGPTHSTNVGGTGATYIHGGPFGTGYNEWAASGVDNDGATTGFQSGSNGSLSVPYYGLPVRLLVTTQPVNPSIAGAPMATVVVNADDGNGNPAFNFNGANGVVDVSLNASGANFDGASTTTVNAVNGTATFSNLIVDYGTIGAVLDFTSNNGFFIAPNATITVSSNPFNVDLPTPIIATVAPTLVNEDIAGVTLSVFGGNFYAGAIVTFKGQPVSSLIISKTSLLASVPAVLLTTPGPAAVQVTNLFNGGAAPVPGTVMINDIPDAALLSSNTVAENMPVGTVVGTLSTTDAFPVGDSHIYTLLTGATNFEVVGTQLRTRASFDFEGGPGSYNISIRVTDSFGGSVTTAFTVTIADANDAPVAVADSALAATEDTPFVSSISLLANDTDEGGTVVGLSAPNLAVLVANATNGNVALATDGTFTYTPNADFNGADSFSYQVQDGTLLSNTVTVSINVAAVNDAPVFAVGSNPTVLEDSGSASLSAWATGVAAGPPDETESVSFNIVGVSGTAVTNVALSSIGELTFDTVADDFGTVTIDVSLTDNGAPAATSATQQFIITVDPVNDAPSFTIGSNVVVAEDSGTYGPQGFMSQPVTGPANENSQSFSYSIVGNSNPSLFSVAPTISNPNAELDFTPAPDAVGVATIDIVVTDTGGTANGGVDTSASQSFTITITNVNDAPVITLATSGSSLTTGGANDFNITLNPTTLPGDVSLEVLDIDGDVLDTTITIGTAPAGITSPAALTGAASGTVFSWTGDATTSAVGTHVYTVTVTDNIIGAPISYTVGVTVTDVAPSHTIAASWGDGLTQTTAYTASSGIGISPSVMMSWVTDANQSQTLSAVSVTELSNPGTTAFTAIFNSTGYAGAIVMAATRTLIYSDVGLHEFRVTLTDGGSNTFDVFVSMDVLNQGNVQPVAGLPGTTDFVVGSDFEASVDPAGTLANALIQLSDVDGDAITITSVVAAPAALANMSQPAVFMTALPPFNIDFSGTADANETPGVYTYTVTITDNISAPVTFNVNITLNDLAPTWTDGADILTGDGQSNATPYEFTFQVGQLPLPLEIALWHDENLGQTLAVSGTDYTTSPTIAFNPVMTATGSDGVLTLETILNLQPADVGQHDLIVTITDGGGINFVDVHIRIIVNPAPPANTGGGDDDESGCATNSSNNWMLLALLGCSLVGIIRRRRRLA